jgi:hypothetical protein
MGEPQSQVQDKASIEDWEEEEEEAVNEANRVGSTNGVKSGGERGRK